MSDLYRLGRTLWRRQIHRWLLAVVVGATLGIVAGRVVIASVCGSVSVIDGMSMAPTFQPGTRVYSGPITTPLERGDVVVVDDGNRECAIKRIVGMPGETVHLWRGSVFVNRQMLREPYLPRLTYTHPDPHTETFVFHLGEQEYLVLGDNRLCSIDSRTYGPLSRHQIRSRVSMEGNPRPEFAQYTLPAPGKRTIRPLQDRTAQVAALVRHASS